MAEDEIIKHTKAAYQTLKNPDVSWKHKVKEIFIEVLIIIFAVSVSIWLHGWAEDRKDRKEEKEFLTGLKKDLQSDIENITNSKQFYESSLTGINYFIKAGAGAGLIKDSLNKYGGIFFSSTYLEPHVSRYEGLKGSGKFDIIENKELLNNIIDLHQQILSRIDILNKIFNDYNSNNLQPFLGKYLQLDAAGKIANGENILHLSEMRFFLSYIRGLISFNIINAHENGLKKCNEIINQIDAELK
jgi:hypothetical protein